MTTPPTPILARVLNALALNRTPGFHFAGHFLRISFDQLDPQDCRAGMDVGPHNQDANGALDAVSLGVFADIALASAVRAHEPRDVRMATVNLQLQFTGLPLAGPLRSQCRYAGPIAANPQLGLSEGRIYSGNTLIATGTGTFMVLPMPPGKTLMPLQPWSPTRAHETLAPDALTDDERRIVRAARQASDGAVPFAERFWGLQPRTAARGARSRLMLTPQVTNRVGHAQGGILLAQAMGAALASLPAGWSVGGICANYLTAGTGRAMSATATPMHTGRSTAASRIRIVQGDRTPVFEAQATLVAAQRC